MSTVPDGTIYARGRMTDEKEIMIINMNIVKNKIIMLIKYKNID